MAQKKTDLSFVGVRIRPEAKVALEKQATSKGVSLNKHLAVMLNGAVTYDAQRETNTEQGLRLNGNGAPRSPSEQVRFETVKKLQDLITSLLSEVDRLMEKMPELEAEDDGSESESDEALTLNLPLESGSDEASEASNRESLDPLNACCEAIFGDE